MNPNILLRRLLLLDAATCLATGALLTFGAGLLAALLRMPEGLLAESGIFLLVYALIVFWAARQAGRSALPAEIVIALNLAWVAGSLALIVGPWIEPSALGIFFIGAQAAAVAALAGLQFLALRRMQVQH